MSFDNEKGAYGAEAERVVVQRLEERYWGVRHFHDYKNPEHKKYQHRRIDIAVPISLYDTDYADCFIDVKRNIKPSGEFAIETSPYGWLFRSDSHLMVHADLGKLDFIWYVRTDMRDRIRQLLDEGTIIPNFHELYWTNTEDALVSDLMHTGPIICTPGYYENPTEEVILNPNYVHGDWKSGEPCCNNETRNWNGWCDHCGDPCF